MQMPNERYTTEVKEFGENIRKLRESKNMTQFDLEAASGIDRADISRIENGRLDIQFSRIIKLAESLGVETLALFEPSKD
jgi:transcriptional regulator with XRE-family HTH domain